MTAEDRLISCLKEAVISDVVKSSNIPKRTIYNYQNGVPIPLARAEKIAHALGLELYIGPPRGAVEAAPGVGPAHDRQHICRMDKWQAFLEQIEKRLLEKGLKAATASQMAVGNTCLIYNLRRGHKPTVESLERLCEVLNLDYTIGTGEAKGEKYTPVTSEDAGEAGQGLAPVQNRQLAELLAVIVDHWERQNDYGRQCFIEEVKVRWPTLFRKED